VVAAAVLAASAAAQTTGGTTTAPPVTPRLPGIDVSRFQGLIDWQAVAEAGVRFAFVQASRGSGSDCTTAPEQCGPDAYYSFNYGSAKAEGIRVGPYHRAFVGGRGPRAVKSDARTEARQFCATVGELVPGDLRPALDLESPLGDLNPFELRLWAKTWLRSVERRLDARPIIYTNASTWAAIGDPTSFALRGHPLWVANWGVTAPQVPAENWAGYSWRLWQYSSSGRIDGITGRVDRDWLRGGWNGVSITG
jgi:lysozyme